MSNEDEELTELSKETLEHMLNSIEHIAACQKQMKERSGPYYEASKERSRIVQAAWRAAGSPRKVSAVLTKEGIKYAVFKSNGDYEFVSEEERNTWVAWRNERERLRKQFR